MQEITDVLLFEEDLTPEEHQAIRQALAADAGLAETVARWRQIRAHLQDRLDRDLPDRSLLVCYALEAVGKADRLSAAERQMLEAAGPALSQALDRRPGLHDVVRRIQADAALFEEMWEAHRAGTPPPGQDRPPRARHVPVRYSNRRWIWRAALALTVLCFVAIAVLILRRDQNRTTIQTAEGEIRRIELMDGSMVRLMGNTTLSFAQADEGASFGRRVRLRGRAFFDVAPGERAFTVETPTALATVLGTTFGVEASDALTEVVLASGKIAVAPTLAPAKMVVLEEGQMSRVGREALPSTPVSVDVAESLAWTGLFLFRATPVEAIARQLSEHYTIEIDVAPGLRDEPVTGTFEQSLPPGEILSAIAATLGAQLETGPDGRYILGPAHP